MPHTFYLEDIFAPYIETNNKKVQYKYVTDEAIMADLYAQREDYREWKKNEWRREADESMWKIKFEPMLNVQKEPDLNEIDCEGILKLLEE